VIHTYSPAHHLLFLIPPTPMSLQSPISSPIATSVSFNDAFRSYAKRTGEDLLLHPLAARLQSCKSPHDALSVLQEEAQTVDQSPSGGERLTERLGPTVNVLFSLSSSLGEGVYLVIILYFPFTILDFSFFSGTIARESHPCRHRCPFLSQSFP